MSLYIWNKLKSNSCCDLKSNIFFIQKCLKKKKARNNAPTNITRALEYYDTVYPPVYGQRWEVMKAALFKTSKYTSLLNNFSDNDKILREFEELCAFDVGAFYNTKRQNLLDVSKSKHEEHSTSDICIESTPRKEVSNAVRPSLIELTDDEKAALAKGDDSGIYPNQFKIRAISALGIPQSLDLDAPRVVKGTQLSSKQVAATFDHIPSTKLKGLEDWVEESDVLSNAKVSEQELGVGRLSEKEPIAWPEKLKLFSFVKGENEMEFPEPQRSPSLSVFTHALLNGASILPILALDIQVRDSVLDVCSTTGQNTLAILQTFLPELVVCNGLNMKSYNSNMKILDKYIPKDLSAISDTVTFTQKGVGNLKREDFYDKALIEAPCLEDRISLQDVDDPVFKSSKVHERVKMPEVQANLILSALKSVKPGGCVVYFTRTLSPLQNDGAVLLALTRVWRETKMECSVVDMLPTMKNLSFMFKMGHDLGLRFGHVVLPMPDNNYGPLYVAKIARNR